jgi:hypothetical protein
MSDVNFEIKCLTCKESESESGALTQYFLNSTQSSNKFMKTHKMFNKDIARSMQHIVGPPGLYSIKCHRKDNDDYVSADMEGPRLR